MVLPSSQDEALARYSVSKDVPGSVLKCEMVLGTLDATPKVPQHAGLTQGDPVQAIESEKMKKENQQNLEVEKVYLFFISIQKEKKIPHLEFHHLH